MPSGVYDEITTLPPINLHMSEQAKGFHSISFVSANEVKNTWDDWHLVPTSRPLVAPPEVKTHIVEIPGSSNYVDLTEAIAGKPIYRNRTGSWEFLVVNSKQLDAVDYVTNNGRQQLVVTSNYGLWYNRYGTIMTFLHGKELDIVLNDDPDYYYTGRLSVNSWKSRKDNSTITIDYNLEPYKRDVNGINGKWLWDPFYLGDPQDSTDTGDEISNYKNIRVRNHLIIDFVATANTSVPTFITTANMEVNYNGVTWLVEKGRNYMDGMYFSEGHNSIEIYGNGYVTIEAIGGIL